MPLLGGSGRTPEVESIVRSESPTDHAPTRVVHDAEIESRGIESGRHSPDSCVIKAHNLDECRVEACGDIMTQEVLRRSTGRCRGRKVAMTIGIRKQSIILERPDIGTLLVKHYSGCARRDTRIPAAKNRRHTVAR